MIYFI